MNFTVEKALLLGADVLVMPEYIEFRWREWDDGFWRTKVRRVTIQKGNLIAAQTVRIKEIQLKYLN